MRIMVWANTFWPHIGGIEVLGAKLFPALKSYGHELIVITRRDPIGLPERDIYDGIPIYRFDTLQALKEGNVDQLLNIREQVAKLKMSFKPDLIYLYQTGSDVLFHLQTMNVYAAPVLVTLHETFPYNCISPNTLVGRALRSADWITTCSADVRNRTCQQIPEIKSISSAIANSLDEPEIEPEPLSFKTPRVLCVGRMVPQKGFDLALEAFASIGHLFPSLRLTMAGDGSSLSELKQKAAFLGIEEKVEFTGWISPDKIPDLMNQSSIVVVPSRKEPFGLVALQASQMARPVVATQVGGLPEIIRHHETGLLVEKENVKELAQAITFLLDHPETAIQMGRNGRIRIREFFNWKSYVKEYDNLFSRLSQSLKDHELAVN